MTPEISVGGRLVSSTSPAYVIAEVGVNHNGDVSIAHRLVDEAKAAGANAVKFQTFRAEAMVAAYASKAEYQARATGGGSQLEMLRPLELADGEFRELRDHCVDIGIDFMSTAFDQASLAVVAALNPSGLKWPSGEITNWPLLRTAATYDLPILISTGMASIREIAGALQQLPHGHPVALMQCVSNYPAPAATQNLRVIPAWELAFGVPVGFSDHTLGPNCALAARALGMSVLEKHITLDPAMPGPDHAASMGVEAFSDMVSSLREVELALGDGIKTPMPEEEAVRAVARKGLVYARDMQQGDHLEAGSVTSKRPALGIEPTMIDLVLGRRLLVDVECDEPVDIAHLGPRA